MKIIGNHFITVIITALIFTGFMPPAACAFQISWSVFHKGADYFKKVQGDPKRLVEEYCEAEFNGALDMRIKVARLSPKPGNDKGDKKEKAAAQENAPGKVLNFSSDPLVVVDSYLIRDINVQKDHAEATVAYKRMANSDGKRYAVEKNSRDVVTLMLDYDGSRWWIKDPPPPRVSKWALIEFSERIISSMNDLIKTGKASDGQKKYYQSHKDIVIFLRSLSPGS